MKYLVLGLTLALGGCTTLASPLSPSNVNALKTSCATVDQLYPSFLALAEGGLIKGSAVRNGELAYQVTRPLCALPAEATYNDVVVVAVQMAVLAKILRDSE